MKLLQGSFSAQSVELATFTLGGPSRAARPNGQPDVSWPDALGGVVAVGLASSRCAYPG